MLKLLKKEMKLTASVLSYLFILFGFLTFCPGYPILVQGFLVCLGIFQSFQAGREANDVVYTALLPVSKSDVVRSKFIFCVFIELCNIVLSAAITLLRMTLLADVPAYRNNPLMNANLPYLAYLLLIYACFNLLFAGGFFKTAYKLGKPFVAFSVAAFLIVCVGETLCHIPGIKAVNAVGFEHFGLQLAVLLAGVALYGILTLLAQNRAIRSFETIDL